jgi:hypothetical protein
MAHDRDAARRLILVKMVEFGINIILDEGNAVVFSCNGKAGRMQINAIIDAYLRCRPESREKFLKEMFLTISGDGPSSAGVVKR